MRKRKFKLTATQRKLKAAWQMVFRAERDGRLKKPSHCQYCRKATESKDLFAHHVKYSGAWKLKVVYLCGDCHKQAHKEGNGKAHAVKQAVSFLLID
jgi:5-methylcytosine-specific restriction endonuclease McrA